MLKRENRDFMEKYRIAAHRGAYDPEEGIPENSLAAFERAVAQNVAVEFDVRVTADDRLVIFHDRTLERMCGIPGSVEDWTLTDLKKLRLQKTEQQIPTLEELLAVTAGQIPLLIEIKNDRPGSVGRLEKLLLKQLSAYEGDVILESFNPEVLIWLRRNAPDYIRGQLGDGGGENRNFRFYSQHLMFNPLTRPDFIAFDVSRIDYKLRLACKKHGVPLIGWTVRTQEDLKRAKQLCDGFIYERMEL